MTAARDRTHAPKANNAYFTIDPRPIPALLSHVDLSRGKVWEPAAGKLHLAQALQSHGHIVYCTDIQEYPTKIQHPWLAHVQDFFAFSEVPDESLRCIVTNPPNDHNISFAQHALKLMEPVDGVIAFYQRHDWDCAKRTAAIFDHPAFAMKITPRWRPIWFEKKKGEKTKSPFHRFSWFVWDFRHIGPPEVRYA